MTDAAVQSNVGGNDEQLAQLKVALANAVTDNQAKSTELDSLGSIVNTLKRENDVSKVIGK